MARTIQCILIATCISLFVILPLGIFSNPPPLAYYQEGHTVYIDRGYPIAWHGVVVGNGEVKLPMIRYGIDKVLDLKTFLPQYVVLWLIVFFLARKVV